MIESEKGFEVSIVTATGAGVTFSGEADARSTADAEEAGGRM